MTGAAAGLSPLSPAVFVAFTVQVYAWPLVKPVTVHTLSAVLHVLFPGFDVTVYPVMAAPPLLAGTLQDTATC